MSVPVIALFNNKGGVGKTSLAYHLAWMYSDMGVRVLAADLDPQANLSAFFRTDDQLELAWGDGHEGDPDTVYEAVELLIRGLGDVVTPRAEAVYDALHLVTGDLSLSAFEDELSAAWPECADGRERGFRVISAFSRLVQGAAEQCEAQLVLMDLGPNLGAINRAALIAADHVLVPLAADLFSLRGLENLGPTLRRWREDWSARLDKARPEWGLPLPSGTMRPLGYVVMQPRLRLDRPVLAYDRWVGRIPSVYRDALAPGEADGPAPERPADDPSCLAIIKHYSSLVPMAQEARKPVFHLKAADGAIGAHSQQVGNAWKDFRGLAEAVLERAGIGLGE